MSHYNLMTISILKLISDVKTVYKIHSYYGAKHFPLKKSAKHARVLIGGEKKIQNANKKNKLNQHVTCDVPSCNG